MPRNILIHTEADTDGVTNGGAFVAWVESDSALQRPNACARSGRTYQEAFNRCMEAYRADRQWSFDADAVFAEA
jgi:hypothetical protein